jgi:tetratricopeptide (TPR) repeat protein
VDASPSQEAPAADTADARIASRERMKRELCAFLQALALERPLVVFLDDLHWADVSTIDMLSYVGARCRSMALLLIGAYRPSDLLLARHSFLEVRRELQGRGLCREIAVGLLREEDIATFVDREFPDHEFPPSFPAVVHARTEGHPLFMTDLLGDLSARAVVARRDERWVLTQSVPEIQRDLPQSTRGMIERKIARLEDTDRRLLHAAAVQGQEFDSATVARAAAMSIDEAEERLEALSGVHHLVHPVEDRELPNGTLTQRYRFAHVLYQNALFGALRRRELVRLSEAVAAALVEAYGEETGEIASSLAHLFEVARWHEEACDYFLLAAQHAAELYANQEAVLLARRALANAEKLEGKPRLQGILAAARQLGQLHLTLSQMTDAIADFEVAERAAADLGQVESQVNAICAAAVARFNLKRMDETRAEVERALAIARAAGSTAGEAAAELVMGLERMCYGAIEDAERSFERSVPVLRETGPPLFALEAVGFAALQQAWQLDYEQADRAVGWTLHRAREVRSPYHVIMNLFVRGMLLFNQGRLSDGLRDLEEGMRIAEQNEERYWLSRFPNTLGWVFTELQDREVALRLNQEGARLAHENQYGKPEANSQLNLAQHHLDLGELDRAFGHLERAEVIFAEDIWFRWRYEIRLQAELARYWLLGGDPVRAGRAAAESLALAEPRKARKHIAWAHKVLGDVAAAEERWNDARASYETAVSVISRHRCPIVEWKILLAAAGMAAARGDAALADGYRRRTRQVIGSLADSITDDRLRRRFLESEAIRAALA